MSITSTPRRRSSSGRFVARSEFEDDEGVDYIQSIQTAAFNFLYKLFFLVLCIPIIYHLLVKRNILVIIKDWMENEFGCNCKEFCENLKSNIANGY